MSDRPPRDEVQDPDNYTTNTRLEHIFDARRELREIRREASKHRHKGASIAKKMRAVQYYRSGVESYIMELDNLFQEHESGRELWEDTYYGTVEIRPPGQFTDRGGYYVAEDIDIKGKNIPLKTDELPETKSFDIIGLKWLFETDSPIQAVFEYPIEYNRYQGVHTEVESGTISWVALNRMVSDVNAFLGDLGIGLDVGDAEDGGWNTEYRTNGHHDPSA